MTTLAAPPIGTFPVIEELGQSSGFRGRRPARGLLGYVALRRLERAKAKARAKREAGAYAAGVPKDCADRIVRWTCLKAAVSGFLSGVTISGAQLAAVETLTVGAIAAVPVGVGVITGELLIRTVLHVDMACELAELYQMPVVEGDDALRVLALAAGFGGAPCEGDRSGARRGRYPTEAERAEVVRRTTRLLFGESVLRNLFPIVGIATSTVTNFVITRRLGERLRDSFHKDRAMAETLTAVAGHPVGQYMDLVMEGLWFVFTADGVLSAEELACLAHRLDTLDAARRKEILSRFVEDPRDWLDRVTAVPEEVRDDFVAILDKAASLTDFGTPLPKGFVRRVAEALGRASAPSAAPSSREPNGATT
jgi:hypothetical protein